MAWRCVTSLLAGLSVEPRRRPAWPAGGGGGDNARRRFIGPGPPTTFMFTSVLHALANSAPSSSRPRAADGQCGSLRTKALVRSSRKR